MTLADRGFDLILHYFKSAERAEELAHTIRAIGQSVWLVQADLHSREGVYSLVEKVKHLSNSLALLVNNASVFPERHLLRAHNSILEEEWGDWEHSLGVNARAPFFLIKELYPLLINFSHPSILNILDSSVTRVFLTRASHSVSKRALAAINELGAATLFPPIRVNALEIGKISFSPEIGFRNSLESSGDQVHVSEVLKAAISLVEDGTANGCCIKV